MSARNFAHLFDHSTDLERHNAGALIYNEGDPGHTMYVIKEGLVEIRFHGNPVATLEPGDIFGEMALIEGHIRIASAASITDTVLIPIDQRRFHFMVTQTPRFATDVMSVMAERIKLLLENTYGVVRK